MKRFLPLVATSLCLTSFLFSPAPVLAEDMSYEELVTKAEHYLIPDEKKIVYEGAAIILFHRAAKAAPNEGQKLEALLRAGYVEEQMKQYPSAIKSYEEAAALQNPSPLQKQRARLALSLAKFQLAKQKNLLFANETQELLPTFEKALSLEGLPVVAQIKTREAIAELHAEKSRSLPAVQQYQEILELPGLSPQQRQNYLQLALTQLGKSAASPEAQALLNKLAPQHLALLDKPNDIAQAKLRWASALLNQNNPTAALAKYGEVASDAALPTNSRTTAIGGIIGLQKEQKNYTAALATADRWPAIDPSPYGQLRRVQERAKIFEEQKKERELQAEWQAFLQLPTATPANQSIAWEAIAASLHRQFEAAPNNDALRKEEKDAYLAVWKLEGVPAKNRLEAFLSAMRTHIEAEETQAAIDALVAGLREIDGFRLIPAEKAYMRLHVNLSLVQLYRATKQYAAATAAAILAQGDSGWNDKRAGEQATVIFAEASAASDWPAARACLTALSKIWHIPHKPYFYNLANIEVKAQNWDAAKVALDEFDKLNPTPAEKKEADSLRAMLPK